MSERGRVPKPPVYVNSHVTGTVGVNRYPEDDARPRSIVGSCFHTSQGTFRGNDSVFHDPSWGGLTDYQVGGTGDGDFDGVIQEFIDPNSGIVPYANGGWAQVTPFGDGPRFEAAFGVYAINQRLRSIEHPDQGNPLTPLSPKQFESSAFLTAWIHAEQAHQTADTFDWQMAHAEFGAEHQQCPGPRFWGRVNEYQDRAKAIMRAYQEGTPLDPPLSVTYPPGWDGPEVPPPDVKVHEPAPPLGPVYAKRMPPPSFDGHDTVVGEHEWRAIDRVVQTVAEAPRLQSAGRSSRLVGPPIPLGQSFRVNFVVEAGPWQDNSTDKANRYYYVTPSGTRVPMLLCSPHVFFSDN